MTAGSSIKARYRLRLQAFVALISLLIFAAFSGSNVVEAVQARQWSNLVDLRHVVSLALPLATLILDGLLSPDLKAVLVFWRWKNVLPAHEAYTVHGEKDSRVDMAALEEAYGPLPSDSAEQNRHWYKLSKAMEDRASVDEAHYTSLLTRDLTSLSFGLLVVSAALAVFFRVGGWQWVVLVSAQALLYLALSQVAKNKGIRFVTTVLAEASASR
jgi:hypothetical protein